MDNSRRKLVPFWVSLLFGLSALLNLISKPRFATLPGPDVLQLIAIGFCFGVALATLIAYFRGPRSS